ncbi:Dabb family protein [Pseudoxanthomonas wuyuanensis]|uniref:Stress responsive A/B Barrel Domain n=1 Tax=Pseudoxanthomonas wuyuanensis TaxID=1073196 RepID=A0A286CWI3_9GAMM|nr:Dabb family protein [Pseudoxanthomonas wuyuanensis]KAF1720921.1 stress protein [Pseudoxanthomonas wuyuanensis]SOD50770.1 Stress responsive A/B Barrel Domain [Pseudoxanthomonas wuyuanensis]
MTDRSRRDVIVAAAALAAGVAATGSSAATSMSASKASFPPVVHHVFFWLKNPDSEEDLAKLLAGLRTLAGIDTVRGIHIGVPADTEQRGVVDGSYSASEILFFDDVAGQDAYQVHPIHKQFIAACEHLWQRVVVYDVKAVAP